MIRILVGLGNPGPEYQATRHNVGFRVLDTLALHEGLLFQTARNLESSLSGDEPGPGPYGGPRNPYGVSRNPYGAPRNPYGGPRKFRFARSFDPDALLVKPEAFMNRSGDVVGPLARWAGVLPERILVVYDDLDLDLGVLRLRPHGGAGGHRGMRSLIETLGSNRFPRLRVGVGRPRTDAARYVLEPFAEKELEDAELSIAQASDAALDWLSNGDIERCMTRFHSRWNQGAENGPG